MNRYIKCNPIRVSFLDRGEGENDDEDNGRILHKEVLVDEFEYINVRKIIYVSEDEFDGERYFTFSGREFPYKAVQANGRLLVDFMTYLFGDDVILL